LRFNGLWRHPERARKQGKPSEGARRKATDLAESIQ
jgi:hypothetical protein